MLGHKNPKQIIAAGSLQPEAKDTPQKESAFDAFVRSNTFTIEQQLRSKALELAIQRDAATNHYQETHAILQDAKAFLNFLNSNETEA